VSPSVSLVPVADALTARAVGVTQATPTTVRRTSVDVARSMGRYMSMCFPDWEVALIEEQGVFDRPIVMVSRVGNEEWSGRGQATSFEVVSPWAVYAFPVPGADEYDGLMKAMAVEEMFVDAFRVGVGLGRPMSIPLWDFENVPLDETGMAVRHYSDYARIRDLSVGRQPDPDDPTLWTVTAALRLGYGRLGRVPSAGPLIQSVTIAPTNELRVD